MGPFSIVRRSTARAATLLMAESTEKAIRAAGGVDLSNMAQFLYADADPGAWSRGALRGHWVLRLRSHAKRLFIFHLSVAVTRTVTE
jgi:hypothetical protein